MTDEELGRLEKLAAAAAPGPWVRHDTGTSAGVAAGAAPDDRAYLHRGDRARRICYMGKLADNEPNLDFIAAARTAVPELVAEVRRLRAELNRVAPLLALRGVGGYRLGPVTPPPPGG